MVAIRTFEEYSLIILTLTDVPATFHLIHTRSLGNQSLTGLLFMPEVRKSKATLEALLQNTTYGRTSLSTAKLSMRSGTKVLVSGQLEFGILSAARFPSMLVTYSSMRLAF